MEVGTANLSSSVLRQVDAAEQTRQVERGRQTVRPEAVSQADQIERGGRQVQVAQASASPTNQVEQQPVVNAQGQTTGKIVNITA